MSTPTPIPMLARSLDMVYGPPAPGRRMTPSFRGGSNVWLCPENERTIDQWHINPGEPGQPEHLPWKRRVSAPSEEQ